MVAADGAKTFGVAGSVYDAFMGRYSRELAGQFAEAAGVMPGQTAVDVGCGPGALTSVLVERLGADAVSACDPSATFLEECAVRHPGIHLKAGRAESIPFDTDAFDHAMAQLVLHFVSEPERAAREMARVVHPGGVVSACVWDFREGMQMLRSFWDAALAVDRDAPDEARTLRFGQPGEIAELLAAVGVDDVAESTLQVAARYGSFDELWDGFLAGVGPAGAYCVAQTAPDRRRIRAELHHRLDSPAGSFALTAVARCAVGRVPS